MGIRFSAHYLICPKCTMFYPGFKFKSIDDAFCHHCGTKLILTEYASEKYQGFEGTVFYPKYSRNDPGWKLLKLQYVKDNPLYDPVEEEKTILKEEIRCAHIVRDAHAKFSDEPNEPKCPTCGSTNITKIGAVSRGVSIVAFGIFSSNIGKTMKCNKCGYKW